MSLLDKLLEKQAEEEQANQLEKFASEVWTDGFSEGWTKCLQKLAEDLVTPGDSPAGNQVAMTIQKALELSTGGDPQVIDSNEEAEEAEGEKTASEDIFRALMAKLAEGEEDPTSEEVELAEELATTAQAAQADLQKQELKAAIKAQLTNNQA